MREECRRQKHVNSKMGSEVVIKNVRAEDRLGMENGVRGVRAAFGIESANEAQQSSIVIPAVHEGNST